MTFFFFCRPLLSALLFASAYSKCCKKCCKKKSKLPALPGITQEVNTNDGLVGLPGQFTPIAETESETTPRPQKKEIQVVPNNNNYTPDSTGKANCHKCLPEDQSEEWRNTPVDQGIFCFKMHETAFDKFYKCVNGQQIEYDCPANLVWHHDILTCDWPPSL